MKSLFTLVGLAGIMFSLWWFIQFQRDPYTNCRDHDDKEMSGEYYECWPGDFVLSKGVLEKTLQTNILTPTGSMKRRGEKAVVRKRDKNPEEQQVQGLEPMDPSSAVQAQ